MTARARQDINIEPSQLLDKLKLLGFELAQSHERELKAGYDYDEDERQKVLSFKPSTLLQKISGTPKSMPTLDPQGFDRNVAAALAEIPSLYLKAVAVVRLHSALDQLAEDTIDLGTESMLRTAANKSLFRTISPALAKERVIYAIATPENALYTISEEEAEHIERLVADTDSNAEQQERLSQILAEAKTGAPILQMGAAARDIPDANVLSFAGKTRDHREPSRTKKDALPGQDEPETDGWSKVFQGLEEPARFALLKVLANRLPDRKGQAGQANLANLGSHNAPQNDTIEGSDTSSPPLHLSEYDSSNDIFDAVERQELEHAFQEVRKPTDPDSMIRAGTFIREHIFGRLLRPEEGEPPIVAALRSFEEDLGRLSAFLRDWPEFISKETPQEQLITQQEQLFAVRSALDEALQHVQGRISQLAEVVAQREQRFSIVGSSQLKRGVELVDTLRAENKSCIVVRRGARKERALLTPYQDGMRYDAEVLSNAFYVGASDLVKRAFSGERILIKDGNSGSRLAVIAPLSAPAELYWNNVQSLIGF